MDTIAAMNMFEYVFLWKYVHISIGIYVGVELLGYRTHVCSLSDLLHLEL